MISIYTRTNNIFKFEFWKHIAKKTIGKYSGPDAVLDSLKRGLTEMNIPFELNPLKPKYDIIHVLSGIEALRDSIRLKKIHQTLLVGPTMITTTDDYDGIISNEKIDIILTPSEWVKDFYSSTCPAIKDKVFPWASGVQIPTQVSDEKGKVIVIKKNIDQEVFIAVINMLDIKNIKYELLEYGKFSHHEYLTLLQHSPYVVYLQKTESQGLALQEAWSYNVPTIVYQNTEWNFKNYSWSNHSISAPYLSPSSGTFFTLDNFEDIISKIDLSVYEPRNYCKNNLSDLKSAQNLIQIIKTNNEKTH